MAGLDLEGEEGVGERGGGRRAVPQKRKAMEVLMPLVSAPSAAGRALRKSCLTLQHVPLLAGSCLDLKHGHMTHESWAASCCRSNAGPLLCSGTSALLLRMWPLRGPLLPTCCASAAVCCTHAPPLALCGLPLSL